MKKTLLAAILILNVLIFSQTFTEIDAGLIGVSYGSSEWGDYDNDGDLDLLILGQSYSGTYSYPAKVYRNDNGIFTEAVYLGEIVSPSGKWGDYDNDGDLDIVVTGRIITGKVTEGICRIYRNDSGVFTDINAGIKPGINSVDWGDFDNDGDLDLAVGSNIYRNDDGQFTDVNAGLKSLGQNYVSWGDYDNDGDLDILLSGASSSTGYLIGHTIIYRNDSGIFVDINAGLEGIFDGSVAWGDYDNDGDLDILMTGKRGYSNYCSKIYRNDSGLFTDIEASLTGMSSGQAKWGDFNNDGFLDAIITGFIDNGDDYDDPLTKLYIYGGSFYEAPFTNLANFGNSSVACGDYDNDGDLDLILTGWMSGSSYNTKIYRNDILDKNIKPLQPSNLLSSVIGTGVTLSWDKATDGDTPQNGLSYNLYIGSVSQSPNIFTPMSNIQSGYRKVVERGNCSQNNSWDIKNLITGQYYWSVQAIDHSFAGSEFADEQTFVIPYISLDAPVASVTNVQDYGFTANWSVVSGANEYRLDISTDSTFSTFVEGYENFFLHPDLISYEVQNLDAATLYYVRIRAFNGEYSPFSNIVSVLTADKRFVAVSHSLTDVELSDWGDYDNDGDMDILAQNYILINDNGSFNRFIKYRGYALNSVPSFGDYDNDGDLDILYGNELYENNYGGFSLKTSFWEITFDTGYDDLDYREGTVYWYDVDNDSYPDIFLSAIYDWYWNSGDPYDPGVHFELEETFVYKNNGDGTFSASSLGNASNKNLSFADYDNDGDMDFYSANTSTSIYRNDSGSLTTVNVGIENTTSSSDWGDYDNDGDPDLIQTGRWFVSGVGYSMETQLYRNDGISFIKIPVDIPGAYESSIKWGDYDNDGDLDILLTGRFEYYGEGGTRIYRNDSGVFTDINAGLNTAYGNYIKAMWCDYDNDGDLDLFSGQYIYRNDTDPGKIIMTKSPNTPPQPPAGLTSFVDGSTATLSWSKSTDAETPQDGLSYSIYIGTSPATGNKLNPESDIPTGYRKIVTAGSAGQTGIKNIRLPNGTYYWGVQAIDNGYSGSPFSTEQTFIIETQAPPAPIAFEAESVTTTSFRAKWNTAATAEGYYLDVAKDSTFTQFVSGYVNKNVGNVTQYAVSALNHNTEHFYRVRAYNISGTSISSNTVSVTTLELLPPVSKPATELSEYGFKANWDYVSGAAGYYLDVALDSLFTQFMNGYENKDVGQVYNFDLTELLPNTEYFYRLRTYISSGFSDNSNVITVRTIADEFSDTQDNIPYTEGCITYGDYDNDGDLDLLLCGEETKLYQKNDSTFKLIETVLPGIIDPSAEWGDIDNDGDIDLLISGYNRNESSRISRVYRNDSGVFTETDPGLSGVSNGSVSADDFDNDGDTDLFISGFGFPLTSKIYRNDEGSFTDISAELAGVYYISSEWFDYDNDGDKDLIVSGYKTDLDIDMEADESTILYKNNGEGTFTDAGISFKGLAKGSIDVGDYDNDGYPDILITGVDTEWGSIDWEEHWWYDLSYAYVYHNNGDGTFTDINAGLKGVNGSALWYDHDNDGDLDIFISGIYSYRDYSGGQYDPYYNYVPVNKLYINDGGLFTETDLDNSIVGKAIAGDHDNDGDTDIFITGEYGSKFFKNNSANPNTLPATPTNLSSIQAAENSLTFSWDKSTDIETPQNGLSYNLYIGTQPDSCDVMSPMSDISTGYRRIVGLGNAQQNTLWTIKDLPPGTYYWSVQAIDHSYAGSEFAPEQTITVTGIEDELIPLVTELYQNYPNPFNPATEIRFSLAEDAKVNLSVYNTNGQLVRTLLDGKTEKGYHTVNFDASELNSGMYLYRLDVNGKVQTKKMLMLK